MKREETVIAKKMEFSPPTPLKWQRQFAAMSKVEWIVTCIRWKESSWRSIVILFLAVGLFILPLSFLMGKVIITLSSLLVVDNISVFFTLTFLLILGLQSLQAPAKLWNIPELEWYFVAPLPNFLLLIRPMFSLVKALLPFVMISLVCVSFCVIIWHGSYSIIFLLWIISIYSIILSCLVTLLGTLVFTWWLGVRNTQKAVVGAAIIMSIPALLALTTLLYPTTIKIQGVPFLFLLEEPVRIIVALTWKLLTQTRLLTPLEITLLIGVGTLPALLAGIYLRVGNSIYQRIWEGLQQEVEEPFTLFSPAYRSHPIWNLAWRLPIISSSSAVLIGYCWQDTIRNWVDIPTIVVYFLLGIMTQVVPLFSFGTLQEYRDFLPLLGVLILLGENQFILFTISKSLISRLLRADMVLRGTPVTAHTIFSGVYIALLLPLLVIWSVLSLVICLFLGIKVIPITIAISMLALGLAASTSIALSTSIFSAKTKYEYSISTLVPAWILSMLMIVCIFTMTALLLFPTFSAPMQHDFSQLGTRVFHFTLSPFQQLLLFSTCAAILSGIIAITNWAGVYRLSQDREST